MLGITIVLLAAAASSDSFIIGFNYGVKGVRIGNISNGFISLVCFVGTYLSMQLGRLAGCFLDPAWGDAVSGGLFTLLGLWMLWSALRTPKEEKAVRKYSENPDMVDKDRSKVIELRESIMIGLVLCLNNVGLGIGGGVAGIPILLTPLACALFSFLFIKTGCSLGMRIVSTRLSKLLEITAAGLILMLGAAGLLALLF